MQFARAPLDARRRGRRRPPINTASPSPRSCARAADVDRRPNSRSMDLDLADPVAERMMKEFDEEENCPVDLEELEAEEREAERAATPAPASDT